MYARHAGGSAFGYHNSLWTDEEIFPLMSAKMCIRDSGYVMSVLREAGKASAMIEESVEKQHTLADTSAREEDIRCV